MHLPYWIRIGFSLLVILLFITSVIINSISIALPGILLLLVGIIVQIISNVEGLRIVTGAILAPVNRPSTAFNKSPQTIKQYLENKIRNFRNEDRNQFVPLVFKTVSVTRLRDGSTFLSPLEIYNKHRQLVLTGLPGVGKSKVLRELFCTIAELHLRDQSVPVPLWVELNDPENPILADDLLKFWWDSPEKYNLETSFDVMLNTWPPVLFLDGLNEMPLASRHKRAESLANWLEKHPNVHAIVACRVRDYTDDQRIRLGPYVTEIYIEPFEKDQIFKFLRLNASHLATQIMSHIEHNDAIFQLAQIPLHLSMLTQLSLWGQDVKRLPNRLKELYEQYLYRRYIHEKKTRRLNLEWSTFNLRMEKLAYNMVSSDRDKEGSLSVSEKNARKTVGKKGLQDAYNMCLLVRMSEGFKGKRLRKAQTQARVRFFHQSLHGYFALPRLNRALERRVRFGIRLPSNDAAAIIRQIGDLGDTAEIAVDTLISLLSSKNESIRTATMNALVDIGVSAINPLINELLASKEDNLSKMIIEILSKIDEAQAPLLICALRYNDENIDAKIRAVLERMRSTPLQLVEAFWKKRTHPDAFKGWVAFVLGMKKSTRAVRPLLDFLKDEDAWVRADTAWALGKIGDMVAAQPLVDMLKEEANKTVRLYVADAIKNIGLGAVILLIEEMSTATDIKYIRIKEALYSIAKSNKPIVDIIEKRMIERRMTANEIRKGAMHILGIS